MARHKVLIAGVAHKKVKPYFQKFLDSLNSQTYKKFDLLILNDKFTNIDYYLREINFKNYNEKATGGIFTNRVMLIKYAIQHKYKNLIFCDFDDEMDRKRVEESIKELKKNDLVVGDVNIINSSGKVIYKKYFSKRFKKNKIKKEDILHSNIIGLSNSAINVKILSKVINLIKIENKIKVFDWFFWTIVLNKIEHAKFSNNIITKYRIHPNNFAGIKNTATVGYLKKGLDVKKNHYKNLKKYGNEYLELYLAFKISSRLVKNNTWLNNYIKKVKINKINFPFWWEDIINPSIL